MLSTFRLRLSRGIAARFEGKPYRRGTIYPVEDPAEYLRMIASGLFVEAVPRQDSRDAPPADPGVAISVIRSRGLGDVLMALPAVQEFARRNPWAEVRYAVPVPLAPLIDAQPWIKGIPWDAHVQDRRIDLSDFPERSGKEARWTRQAIFCSALGLPLDDAAAAALRSPLVVLDAWKQRFRTASPTLILAPLASVADRTIDPDTIDELAERFSGAGWTVWGVGCHAEHALDPGPMEAHDLAGLIAQADLVIAADSGTLHLAGHIETPVVGLFTNWPSWTRMTGYRGMGLEPSWLACNPCFGRGCDPRWCCSGFPIDEILDAARRIAGVSVPVAEQGGDEPSCRSHRFEIARR